MIIKTSIQIKKIFKGLELKHHILFLNQIKAYVGLISHNI